MTRVFHFEPSLMLVLLSASLYIGSCIGTFHEVKYGDSFKLKIQRSYHSIEFMPTYDSSETILWNRDRPEANVDARRKMTGDRFVVHNVTQRDSGRYNLRGRDFKTMSTKTLEVVADTRTYTRTAGEEFSFTFDLEPRSCNIYFFPEGDEGTELVHQGSLRLVLDWSDCFGFDLVKPCGILKKDVRMSCNGHFEVRDHNGDEALRVSLEIETSQFNYSYIFGIGAALLFIVMSCCIKSICVAKHFPTKHRADADADADADASSADEPAVQNYQYDCEPVGSRPSQYAASSDFLTQPSEASIQVSAPAEHADAPTVPLNSEYEPRFELKGMNFDPPLSSDSTHYDVYTSDKLNFL
ncbi:uncharacterized protein LOC133446953 [Cololabis saira]|uniref:uncharacterized protein LOC133446953 n=1 Tax=Cololabis saira TaxID=129043 RepID=UPI002AD36FC3|nr:uncharacterized protein LOC133446953 [Cololabis saira]